MAGTCRHAAGAGCVVRGEPAAPPPPAEVRPPALAGGACRSRSGAARRSGAG